MPINRVRVGLLASKQRFLALVPIREYYKRAPNSICPIKLKMLMGGPRLPIQIEHVISDGASIAGLGAETVSAVLFPCVLDTSPLGSFGGFAHPSRRCVAPLVDPSNVKLLIRADHYYAWAREKACPPPRNDRSIL
jgi:hypothetical protein